MYAIEFDTKIKNGLIEIPQEYRDRLLIESKDEQVRVILLTSGVSIAKSAQDEDMIAKLLSNPLPVADFVPMNREDIHERA